MQRKSEKIEPAKIEPVNILGFLTCSVRDRGNAAKTRNRKLAALRSYFNYLDQVFPLS